MEAQGALRPKFAYVGCFTTEKRKARGKGIAVFRIDRRRGAWTSVEACDSIPNPHYIALDRTQRFLYSAHGDSSESGLRERPGDRQAEPLNKQPTGGDNSSTVMVDPEQPLSSSCQRARRGGVSDQRGRLARAAQRTDHPAGEPGPGEASSTGRTRIRPSST